MSGQLGRRRDPRVRLEQPPFVRGITFAKKEKKYFNVPPYVPAYQRRKVENSKIINRDVSVNIAKDEQ